jgi:predicted metalloendopeptidase
MLHTFFITTLAVMFLASCSKGPESGVDLSNVDKSIKPQDDLYQYINGKWLEKTEIPADKSNYGTFTELYDQSQIDLKAIIEESAYAKNKVDGSDEQKVGDFYLSFMDSNLVEKLTKTVCSLCQSRSKTIRSIHYVSNTIRPGTS